jgi:hypothetical protein
MALNNKMKTMKLQSRHFPLMLFLLGALGCIKDVVPQEPKLPFQELYSQGIDQYLGVFEPETALTLSPGLIEHKFSGVDAPICFTGNQFSMFTRDGSNENLLIFIQGGGFCGPSSCDAVETGIPLVPLGILSSNVLQNPLANYNLGYLPYCDGSGWMGDKNVDSDGDETNDRFFRGLQNLSASLDVIAKRYPAPTSITLAGNSAGGFGVHAALPLVRKLYPNIPINLINDSGIGILNPGAMNDLVSYWGAERFFPNSCTKCIGEDGNLTEYYSYQLNQDTNIRMAFISSKRDATFAPNIIGGPSAFESQVISTVNQLKSLYITRFNSLIPNGDDHTFIIRRFEKVVSSTSVREWVQKFTTTDSTWTSIIE